MNNHRLLTGLLFTVLMGGGACCYAQSQKVVNLDEIFKSAEAHSSSLRSYVTAEQEAKQEISVAKSAMLPDVNATLSFSYIGDGFTTKRNFSDYRKAPIPHFGSGFGINISQPVYTGGATRAGIDLAGLKSTAARFAADLQRDNIRFQLTGFYLDLYKYANLRKVVENNFTLAHKVLDNMKARFEQGTALKNDITRYELLLSNLQLELIRIDNTLQIINHNLVVTAGLDENIIVVPDSAILQHSLPVANEQVWQREAEQNSPALKLAGYGVEISRKAETLEKASKLPKIGMQLGWTIDGPILVEVPPINRNLSYWWVGVGVSYNLSSLWKANKSVAKSKTATRRSLQELAAARDNIEMGVRADYIRYMEAYEELKTREKGVELAQRNYSTTATRYSADMALITDMLDAANARIEAEQQLVNAKINIIYSYYKLLFTSGTI
ncbi:MAG: TolC family protein [Paramuribaculum sp.]|nr:TolC family protein [Paramuribaculum sp.]